MVFVDAQPAATEDHCQTQKDGQQGPGDLIKGRLGLTGAGEYRVIDGASLFPLGDPWLKAWLGN